MLFTEIIDLEDYHKFNLEEKYDKKSGDWYCISCEKRVSRHHNEGGQVHLIKSYFIACNPFNARICGKCLGKTIAQGSTELDMSKMTRKEYNRS